jgi:glyoxylase-like metal-dependent hydrolase (beta-lactamase superfamily II)/ferredoxin
MARYGTRSGAGTVGEGVATRHAARVARLAERLPDNAPGEFFVDASCIDCAVCREVAPEVFAAEGSATEQSYVRAQPVAPASRLRAAMALVACPTASIGTVDKIDLRAAVAAFPDPIEDGVSFCGYASESSFGAQSYLVRRPAGNVLVDSPRFTRPLVRRLEELGGVAMMFLTHRDDVADHARFRAHFGCERVLHRRDVSGDTADVERKLDGDAPIPLAPDLLAIPVPGHTRGSTALLHAGRFLFSGDHLWRAEDEERLEASRSVCWFSWPEQTRSMERLIEHRFEWVLPGHGRRFRADSPAAMERELRRLVLSMRARA